MDDGLARPDAADDVAGGTDVGSSADDGDPDLNDWQM